MTSTRIACFALSASALFLGGMLVQSFTSPTAAQAATVNWQGAATVATAKLMQGDDGLYILVDDTLSVYHTNVASKKLELLGSQKISMSAVK